MSGYILNPTGLETKRSMWRMPSQNKTSFSAGKLIPIYCQEILPGDTFDMKTASVIRMGSTITCPLDNCYMDTFWFFVPNRIIWDHWKQFMGENDTTAWTQKNNYVIPAISSDEMYTTFMDGTCETGCLLDYFGLPVGSKMDWSLYDQYKTPISVLPIRAYFQIWNDWFRNQVVDAPVLFSKGDTDTGFHWMGNSLDLGERYFGSASAVMPVNKYPDVFTTALPEPQKGDPVTISLTEDLIPLVSTNSTYAIKNAANPLATDGVRLGDSNGAYHPGTVVMNSGTLNWTSGSSSTGSGKLDHINLYGDASGLTVTDINTLRFAFAAQKVLERDAIYGSRYVESVYAHFGVRSPDASQQRSELLGETHTPINMDQVVATSSFTNSAGVIGNTLGQIGGVSKTAISGHAFTKSFTEHGYLIGVACIRTDHTYSQGIEKHWLHSERIDIYTPEFATIGYQPINKLEVNAYDFKDGTFGYQEAWYEYRFKPSHTSGMLNPANDGGLDYWTYADDFGTSSPVIGPAFSHETPANIARTLQVTSSGISGVTDQFAVDWLFNPTVVRVMPVHSVPGLIDHH